MLEYLISHFFIMYPDGIELHYPQFRADVLNSLGKVLMTPFFWQGDDLSDTVLKREYQYWMSNGESDFFYAIAPAIFFCLKYLKPEEIGYWVHSKSKITGTHWHYHWLSCLFHDTFLPIFAEKPDKMPKKVPISGNLAFGEYPFTSTFTIPANNLLAFVAELKKHRIYYT